MIRAAMAMLFEDPARVQRHRRAALALDKFALWLNLRHVCWSREDRRRITVWQFAVGI